MRKFTIVVVSLALLVGCSETQDMEYKDKICYSNDNYKVLGLKYDHRKDAVDPSKCNRPKP